MPARVRELRALLLQRHRRCRTSRIWGRRRHKLLCKKEETTRHQARPCSTELDGSAQNRITRLPARGLGTRIHPITNLETLQDYTVIYGGGGGSHPRCQT